MKPALAVSLSIAALFAITCAFAAWWEPFHFHYAGGDPSDYVNNGVARAYEHPSARAFYPEEFSGLDRVALDRTFTDMRYQKNPDSDKTGIMTPFVRVYKNNEVRIAHDNVNAVLIGVAYRLNVGGVAAYLNYFWLFLAAVFVLLLVYALTDSLMAAVLSALHMFLIPSFVMGARYPMSEALATSLHVLTVLLFVVTGGRRSWPAFLLLILMQIRPEFAAVFPLFALWAGFNRKRGLVTVSILVLHVLFSPDLAFTQLKPWMSLIPYVVGFGLSFVPLGRGLSLFKQWAWLNRHIAWHAVGWVGVVIVIVVLDVIRARLEPGENWWLVRYARYSTVELLVTSVGIPMLIVSLFGLASGSRELAQRLPWVVLFILAPQWLVLVDMRASPTNVWSWTRRFHIFVYPVLIVGAGALYASLERWLRPRFKKFAVVGAVCTVLLLGIAIERVSEFRSLTVNYLTKTHVRKFHDDASRLHPDAIVILSRNRFSMAAQLPLRTFHGLWSFVVWDSTDLGPLLDAVTSTPRPVFVEGALLEKLGHPRPNGVPTNIEVRYDKKGSRTIDLWPVSAP